MRDLVHLHHVNEINTMNLPKLIKSVPVIQPSSFSSGPRICTIQFIDIGDHIVAVDFWYHGNGELSNVCQRELRQEDLTLLAN